MLQGEHHKEHIHFQNAGNFEWKLSTTCSGKQSSNKDDEVEVIANSDNSYFVFHVFSMLLKTFVFFQVFFVDIFI